jgi:hypothetical protein
MPSRKPKALYLNVVVFWQVRKGAQVLEWRTVSLGFENAITKLFEQQ